MYHSLSDNLNLYFQSVHIYDELMTI